MEKWECTACGYIYDPAAGDPGNGIPARDALRRPSRYVGLPPVRRRQGILPEGRLDPGPPGGSDESRHRRQRAGRDDGRQEPEGDRPFGRRSRSSPRSDTRITPGPTSSISWPGPFPTRGSSPSPPTGTSARTSPFDSERPSSASTSRPGPSRPGTAGPRPSTGSCWPTDPRPLSRLSGAPTRRASSSSGPSTTPCRSWTP